MLWALQEAGYEVSAVMPMSGSRHRCDKHMDALGRGCYRLFWADIPYPKYDRKTDKRRQTDTRRRNELWALIETAVSYCNNCQTIALVGGFNSQLWDHQSARNLLRKQNMIKTEHRLCAFGLHLKPAVGRDKPSNVAFCLYHNGLLDITWSI